jgi:anthranilate phosphoribosyltransferase
MHSILKRIATGPELSKDISREEARAGMRLVLDGEVDPVQAGVFLIALRMKRETDDENLGMLEAIREATLRATAPVDEVLDIGDPYDGYNRTLPAAPFLPAVLAACGVASVSHGVESMGPKYGVTHRQVLRAAGLPVDLTPEEAAARLGDPAIGWAYVDQKAFCPKLYALTGLRTLIVKRPAITTAEVLAGPVRGRLKTHLVTGYVHKPYPRIYAMLARHAGYDSALLVERCSSITAAARRPPRNSSRRNWGSSSRCARRAYPVRTTRARAKRRSMPQPWRRPPPKPAWRRSSDNPARLATAWSTAPRCACGTSGATATCEAPPRPCAARSIEARR